MKILLVKLGALGDVLRTTPLLSALKESHPNAEITWLVDPRCREVLEKNPGIRRLLSYSPEEVSRLSKERFDWLINLDKDEEALDAAMAAPADKKSGFGRIGGKLAPFDALSDYAYRLGIDDDLKFRKNQKSYQEISFEQAGLQFKGQEYVFPLEASDEAAAAKVLAGAGAPASSHFVVGLNTGSGHRFAGKRLPEKSYAALAKKFSRELGATVFLLGGRDEIERNREIQRLSDVPVVNTGSHPIKTFAGLVKRCDVIVSGDTTAMHIAIAVKTPVVVHFGSTCAAEIELYGRGKKVVSEIECAPCYKRVCPIGEECMRDMDVDVLFRSAKPFLKKAAAR